MQATTMNDAKTAASAATRQESDLLGTLEVPAEAWYGIHTTRALRNFPNQQGRQRTLGEFPMLVNALVQCKQAAAQVNGAISAIPAPVAAAIHDAGQRVLTGTLYDQFPIHSLHGGGGTSANMNTNEVLANLAEEALGGRRGQYRLVHPNDHVNRHQSTNDVYPTACRMAVIASWPGLESRLGQLADALDERIGAIGAVKRIARTCLQDAVVITFGDLLGGYAGFLRRQMAALERRMVCLHEVSLGGTAVGRASDVPAPYFDAIIEALSAASRDTGFRRAANLFDAFQNIDELVQCAGELDMLSRGLIKIARDLRLMASGPDTGFGEIHLPSVQAGSSMMPGKVNPVIPEFVIQNCFRVAGHAAAARMALDHGELDLNIWESLVTTSILESMDLLDDALTAISPCVSGLTPVDARSQRNCESTIACLTEMAKEHGYAKVQSLWRLTDGDGLLPGARLEQLRSQLGRHADGKRHDLASPNAGTSP